MSTTEPAPDAQAALSFLVQGKSRVGAERIALLEAIQRSGSLSTAAKELGLSYKGAWDAVKTMNNMLPQPVAVTQAGGRHGGETLITPDGRRVIRAFHQVQTELERVMAALRQGAEEAPDILKGLFMRTSARNMLRARVAAITPGHVNTEIALDVSEGVTLYAIVTEQSLKDLDLRVGGEAIALIKSSFVMLALAEPGLKLSARNQIPGHVSRVTDGQVNNEVTVDIGGGKSLSAIVTRDSVNDLGLTPGTAVTCCVKASHVIVAVD